MFEPDIPDFIIIELGQPDTDEKRAECEAKGQKYIQVTTAIFNLLAVGGSSNSAYNEENYYYIMPYALYYNCFLTEWESKNFSQIRIFCNRRPHNRYSQKGYGCSV